MECKLDEKVETITESEMVAAEEIASQEEHAHKSQSNVSRRGLLSGAAAAVVLGAGGAIAIPLLSDAETGDSSAASKDDLSKLEYELSLLKNVSDDAELISHKSDKVDASSTDLQYPSSKAVYEAMTDKIDINQGTKYSGYIFVVGDDGKLKLSKFTSNEWSDSEQLPIENRVIYQEIKELVKALGDLDSVPAKDSTKGVESGGVYSTFQESKAISSFSDIKMGCNYLYEGKINDAEGKYSVKLVDKVMMAISQEDPSIVYTSVDGGSNWGAPYGGW
jgi:hypothetical protein